MTPPISYTHNNHTTYLKWHRARRTSTDAVFTRTRILEAMTYGASLEVDLRIHASSGCAILHNTTLDEETTGRGAVREAPASYLRTLFLRDNDGNATSEPLLLLEDLVETLLLKKQEGEIHPNAVLQLDFKDDVSALSDESLTRIASILKPVATHMILSGGDFAAIRRLGSMVPGLRLGFDPCLGPLAAKLRADGDFVAFVESALNEAPEAEMLYLYFEVVMRADRAGVDVIQRVHEKGKKVDVWTVRRVDGESLAMVRRLLELGVDQITTDDAEGLAEALEE